MLNERNTLIEDDGIEEEILVEEECSVAQAVWGDIQGNIENQTDLQNALDAKQDSLTEAQLNAVNSGITSEKVTTYDGYADQIASKADQSALNAETIARGEADVALGTRIDNEALARQQADNGLQSQIDAITSKSDVVDVVANYAALQAYDTSTLGNNDVVKVLDDETHEDALTYYRWSTTTQTWTYIGQEAPYYSKGQMDVKLAEKQDKLTAGANIQIQNGTISATDTTYTAGNGLNLNGTEFSADTDVLATKEDLEGYYTKPETDNLLAPKLEAEVVAELPTTGAEGKLYLTPKAHTTQTATGNPIMASVTEQAGAIESFQLDGDTFQQTYTGKNLFNENEPKSAYYIDGNGNEEDTGRYDYINIEYSVSGGEDMTVSFASKVGVAYVRIAQFRGDGTFIQRPLVSTSPTTVTLSSDARKIILSVNQSNTLYFTGLQVEYGSTASAYEPFVGGQPSPNPSYPQDINVVTGTQTISINGTDYPISLGSIELCKIGNYQDYIWKDGEDWKVHKETDFTTIDSLSDGNSYSINTNSTNTTRVLINGCLNLQGIYDPVEVRSLAKCNYFVYASNWGSDTVGFFTDTDAQATKNGLCFRAPKTVVGTTDETVETWLNDHPLKVNYILLTPTDIIITDQTLIAQLEAIRTAILENGANTITNAATGSNLAGDMEIGYYGYNPTNRYDKFIWLDLNNNYEQIGS